MFLAARGCVVLRTLSLMRFLDVMRMVMTSSGMGSEPKTEVASWTTEPIFSMALEVVDLPVTKDGSRYTLSEHGKARQPLLLLLLLLANQCLLVIHTTSCGRCR